MQFFRVLALIGTLGAIIFLAIIAYQRAAYLPTVILENASPLSLDQTEIALPLFEIMSPLPTKTDRWLLTKLEYAKGPPERYLERIQIIFSPQKMGPKERIIFYGRRTRDDAMTAWITSALGMDLAHFYEQVFRFASGQMEKPFANQPWYKRYRATYYLYQLAQQSLTDVHKIIRMDQAGIPAFLFFYGDDNSPRRKIRLWYFRKNSLFQVDLFADEKFRVIDPLDFFRKSFLTEKRADALQFVNQALSQVRFSGQNASDLSPQNLAWPMSLLAAHFSLDPSGIDSFYHFAGLSALLYKSPLLDTADTEALDILRNNVLAAEMFSLDIAPSDPKTSEIGQLARNLLRSLN